MPNVPQLVASPRRPHFALSLCTWIALAVCAAGCATGKEANALRDLPPAPLVVMIDWQGEPQEAVAVRYGETVTECTGEEMQMMLASELRALNASSRVVTSGDVGDQQPDITVTVSPIQPIEFEHVGTASFLGAGALWLVTWVGGLVVDDSTYSVRMNATCRYSLNEDDYFDSPITGAETDLSFFERNDLLSLPTLQSLVLPPFWTSDQADKSSVALRQSAMRIAAQQIASSLKKQFEARSLNEWKCSVRLVTPAKNGAPVAGTQMPVEFAIASTSIEGVKAVSASVNGGEPIPLTLGRPGRREVAVTGTLVGLDPTRDNWVRLQVTAGNIYTRTLRLAAKQ